MKTPPLKGCPHPDFNDADLTKSPAVLHSIPLSFHIYSSMALAKMAPRTRCSDCTTEWWKRYHRSVSQTPLNPLSKSNIRKPIQQQRQQGKQQEKLHPSFPHPPKLSFQQERQPRYSQPKPHPRPRVAPPTKQPPPTTHPTMPVCQLAVSQC